jgi:hypothetical protein
MPDAPYTLEEVQQRFWMALDAYEDPMHGKPLTLIAPDHHRITIIASPTSPDIAVMEIDGQSVPIPPEGIDLTGYQIEYGHAESANRMIALPEGTILTPRGYLNTMGVETFEHHEYNTPFNNGLHWVGGASADRYVMSFAGMDPGFSGFGQDLPFNVSNYTWFGGDIAGLGQWNALLDIRTARASHPDLPLEMVGHSLGGSISEMGWVQESLYHMINVMEQQGQNVTGLRAAQTIYERELNDAVNKPVWGAAGDRLTQLWSSEPQTAAAAMRALVEQLDGQLQSLDPNQLQQVTDAFLTDNPIKALSLEGLGSARMLSGGWGIVTDQNDPATTTHTLSAILQQGFNQQVMLIHSRDSALDNFVVFSFMRPALNAIETGIGYAGTWLGISDGKGDISEGQTSRQEDFGDDKTTIWWLDSAFGSWANPIAGLDAHKMAGIADGLFRPATAKSPILVPEAKIPESSIGEWYRKNVIPVLWDVTFGSEPVTPDATPTTGQSTSAHR